MESGRLSLGILSALASLVLLVGSVPVFAEGVAESLPLLVGAYYYPWYGRERHWSEGYVRTPLLGLYDSAAEETIRQHIAWAEKAGINFFAVSWWGPNTAEDLVLKYSLAPQLGQSRLRYAIIYESFGRLNPRSGRVDLDDPWVVERLIADLTYLAQNYFNDPHYLRVDGCPAVIIYVSRAFIGDYETSFGRVRKALHEQGFDLYLIGDEVYWGRPVGIARTRASVFDAITAYNMHTMPLPGGTQGFLARVEEQYRLWSQAALDLGVTFIPNTMPGFDDTRVRPEAGHPIIPRSPEFFRAFTQIALRYVDPRTPILMVTSWNEWHEDTQIEPSQDEGNQYLDVLQELVTAARAGASSTKAPAAAAQTETRR